MESSGTENNETVKTLNSSKTSEVPQDDSDATVIDNNTEIFNGNSIIMVKPCEENPFNTPIHLPRAFGDTSREPRSVITKLYEGSYRHSNPRTIRLKKHARPRSSAENHNVVKPEENIRGLCCTLSERALNPIKIDITPSIKKDIFIHASSQSLEVTSTTPEVKVHLVIVFYSCNFK